MASLKEVTKDIVHVCPFVCFFKVQEQNRAEPAEPPCPTPFPHTDTPPFPLSLAYPAFQLETDSFPSDVICSEPAPPTREVMPHRLRCLPAFCPLCVLGYILGRVRSEEVTD